MEPSPEVNSMGNEGRHFHECPNCHFEDECDLEGWAEYCDWHDLEPQEQRCIDCDTEKDDNKGA